MHPKFLAYLVILCFEKGRSKQKYCCSPKVKFLSPKKFGLATPLASFKQRTTEFPCAVLTVHAQNRVALLFIVCHDLLLIFLTATR